MNYELCKKLKDAGFIQEPTIDLGSQMPFYGDFYYPVSTKHSHTRVAFLDEREIKEWIEKEDMKELIKIPTLEELIEACGEEFKMLYWDSNVNEWCASSGDFMTLQSDTKVTNGCDQTPLVAVANLWLSINKKNHLK